MKAILVVGNSVLEEDIKEVLEEVEVDGYTQWSGVKGTGGSGPHLGTPIWPSLNEAFFIMVDDEKADRILEKFKKMREKEEVRKEGLEIFFWEAGRLE